MGCYQVQHGTASFEKKGVSQCLSKPDMIAKILPINIYN